LHCRSPGQEIVERSLHVCIITLFDLMFQLFYAILCHLSLVYKEEDDDNKRNESLHAPGQLIDDGFHKRTEAVIK